jgi:DNA-binding GntR family transcriptional regulator
MRLTLEIAVLRILCESGIPDQYLQRMSENLSTYQKRMKEDDFQILMALDDEFHRILFEAANKMRTYEVIRKQMIHFDRLRALSLQTSMSCTILNDHENIMYALSKKDTELAELVMTQHLTRHRVEREELSKRYPEYFAN